MRFKLHLSLSLALFVLLATAPLSAHSQKGKAKNGSDKKGKTEKKAHPACDLLNEGVDMYKAGDLQGAIAKWENGMARNGGECSGKCFFNIPMAYQRLDEHDKAREWFQKILDSDLNDKDPGPDIMEPYANYHHNACMEWTRMEWRLDNHDKALALLQLAETKYDIDIFSATTYEKRLVSIARFRSAILLDAGRADSAVMAILQKALDISWGYKGDFASFTNVDFYSHMLEEVDSLAEARFGKAALRDALIAAEPQIRTQQATWEWTGEKYLAAELDLMGHTLRFGSSADDATPETLRRLVRRSPLWAWLGCPEEPEPKGED